MIELNVLLKELISNSGIYGNESPVAKILKETWGPLVDEISVSKLGSLHAFKQGHGKSPRPSLMVSAHMDAIGLIVKRIQNGFIQFTELGGVDPRVLPGQQVLISATGADSNPDSPIPGWILQPSISILPDEIKDEVVPKENLFIDTGLSPDQVVKKINIGDFISFAHNPVELNGETLAGHSLDNRASIAALTLFLQELHKKQHEWDVWAVATSMEEEGLKGAITSGFHLRPAFAIVIDTTWAKGPGSDDYCTFPLSKGPTIDWGPNFHPKLFQLFKEFAEKNEFACTTEITDQHSGTDAYAIQVAGEGIPTIGLGIPIRYMHTPVEVVSLKDIRRVGRLVAEFLSSISSDFLNKLELDS